MSLTSQVNVEVTPMVSFTLNLRYDRWTSAFGYPCCCLQIVITLMDGSEMQLSSGRLLSRHVL